MILAAHNAFTYFRPRYTIGWLGAPFARCQSKTWQEQYDLGVRLFDTRIRFDRDDKPYFCHGFYPVRTPYGQTVESVLLDVSHKNDVRIDIKLEERYDDGNDRQEKLFKEFIERLAPKVVEVADLSAGVRMRDWAVIAPINDPVRNSDTWGTFGANFGSIEKPFLWGACPWLYAKLHNRKNLEKAKREGKEVFMLDFVNIQ